MSPRSQLNIRLDESQKERWTSVVENDPKYQNLTHLILLSVERELKRDQDPITGVEQSESSPEVSTAQINEIHTSINRIEERVGATYDSVQALSRESGPSELAFDPKQALLQLLPVPEKDKTPPEFGVTSTELARRIDGEEAKITSLLDELAEETGIVKSGMTARGQMYYRAE